MDISFCHGKFTPYLKSKIRENQTAQTFFWYTLPETNIAPENGWLEDYSTFGKALFSGAMSASGRVSSMIFSHLNKVPTKQPFNPTHQPRGAVSTIGWGRGTELQQKGWIFWRKLQAPKNSWVVVSFFF